jgi:WD40 repeat protein
LLRGHVNSVSSAAFSPDGTRIVTSSRDETVRIWDAHIATLPINDMIDEVCLRRLRGITKLTRDEMRLIGYPDSTELVDVCAGVTEAN